MCMVFIWIWCCASKTRKTEFHRRSTEKISTEKVVETRCSENFTRFFVLFTNCECAVIYCTQQYGSIRHTARKFIGSGHTIWTLCWGNIPNDLLGRCHFSGAKKFVQIHNGRRYMELPSGRFLFRSIFVFEHGFNPKIFVHVSF